MSSELEDKLLFYIRALRLPEPEREYKFHPVRKWRFDFAYPDKKVAFEIEGGVWTGGRHFRGRGAIADCDKYNEAALQGWTVYRFTTEHVKNGSAVRIMELALKLK